MQHRWGRASSWNVRVLSIYFASLSCIITSTVELLSICMLVLSLHDGFFNTLRQE